MIFLTNFILLIFYGDIFSYIKQGLTFASAIMLDTRLFFCQTDMIVVFTFVLVCNVVSVAQWSRLLCFARETYAFMCCFSGRLAYAKKWTCSAVAGMVICQDNKFVQWEVRGEYSMYTWRLSCCWKTRAIFHFYCGKFPLGLVLITWHVLSDVIKWFSVERREVILVLHYYGTQLAWKNSGDFFMPWEVKRNQS